METLIAGAAVMLLGLATGHAATLRVMQRRIDPISCLSAVSDVECRMESVEKVLPNLATKQELHEAFTQMAHYQQQQQAAAAAQRAEAQRAEAQRARQAAVFGTPPAAPDPNQFNLMMNQQLEALNSRLQQVAGELGM